VAENVPANLRTVVQEKIMRSLIKLAEENGARQLLGLVPAVWSRWIGRLGFHAEPAGPVLDMENWRTQVALMHLNPLNKPRDEVGTQRHSRVAIENPGIIQRSRLRKNRQPAA
jgi:N-acyl-L-homoserine lactone synthetase